MSESGGAPTTGAGPDGTGSDGRVDTAGGDEEGRAPAVAQSFYGRWARLYDRIAEAPGVVTWRDRAADALDLAPGDTVVEMGCGTGANLPHLRERVGADGRVVGVDFTAGMLDRARERVERAGWANVHLVRGDATRPPVAGPVDAVLESFVVGMFDDPERVVEGWLDLLEPGGRIALLDAAPSDRLAAVPLDAAFRAFVVLSTPPTLQFRYASPPWRALADRIRAARRPVADRTVDRRHDEFGLGFVRLTSGRRPVD